MVVRVKRRGGNLHAGAGDEEDVRWGPRSAAQNVEGAGGDEVLGFAVDGAAEVPGDVVFEVGPET